MHLPHCEKKRRSSAANLRGSLWESVLQLDRAHGETSVRCRLAERCGAEGGAARGRRCEVVLYVQAHGRGRTTVPRRIRAVGFFPLPSRRQMRSVGGDGCALLICGAVSEWCVCGGDDGPPSNSLFPCRKRCGSSQCWQ
jgi:hypothetical protein